MRPCPRWLPGCGCRGPRSGGRTVGTCSVRASLVDLDRLEALLIGAARDRCSITYAEVLAQFGIKITPRRVYGLCRDLGVVCERNRARGEPELAVLVVRKSDRLPGDGFFHGAWRDGSYEGPATGPAARAYIDRLTRAVFAFWAERAAAPGQARPPDPQNPAA